MSASAGAAPRPGYVRLAGSVAPFTSHGRAIGAVAGSARLTIQVWMRPGHLAAAQEYATAVSTPGSKLFHHYLSPARLHRPVRGQPRPRAGAVESWLRHQGFTSVHADAERNYVRATGSVAAIDAAFRTRLENYQSSAGVNAGPYQLHANDRPVAIPRSLAQYVIGLTGLDNAAPRLPLMRQPARRGGTAGQPDGPLLAVLRAASHLRAARAVRADVVPDPDLRLPACPDAGRLRDQHAQRRPRADGLAGRAGPGPGHVPDLAGLREGRSLRGAVAQRYPELSLGKNTCGDPFDVEEQLDVETSYDMAPGANQLVVGGDSCNNGDFGNQGLFDADIVTIDGTAGSHHRPLANISSNSWGPGNDTQPAILTNIMHAYLVRAAAQGVGMYFASGDSSGVETPDDPFTILVGGTSLGIGKNNQRLFETGWSSGLSGLGNGKWGPAFGRRRHQRRPQPDLGAAGLPARRGAEGAGHGTR